MKSPIGILFYDKEGRLIAANQSARDIAGIPESEDINLNLFNDPDIALKKKKLIDEGAIKFQFKMDFENIRKAGYYNPTRSGSAYLDFVISVTDSGYLAQIQDITKRKNAENSLKESELYYRTIFENTGTAFMILEEDTTISLVNTEAEKLFGYSKSEIEGKKKWVEFVFKKEDLERMQRYHRLRREKSDAVPRKYEFQGVNKQGNVKNIITTISMIPGTKKSIASFLDITKLKKAEAKLQKSEIKYRELVENANSIILKMDKKGNILFLNEFGEKFFGFKKEEISGKNVVGTIVPETESSGRNLQELINMIIKDPESHINIENENITRDGRRVWAAWTNKGLYNDKGEVIGVLSIGTNISKRKHAEELLQKARDNLELIVQKRTTELKTSNEALRNEIEEHKNAEEALIKSRNYLDKIINTIADPVFVKDEQHRWALLNDAYCDFMGYSREELLGKSDYDFFPQHEADVFWEKDEEVFEAGVENVNEEEFTDSVGDVHTIITKKTLYTDISGEKYIVAVIRDITELKKAESALRKSEGRLKIAMDMAKLVYWEYDVESNMFTFDDRFYALYGTTAEREGGTRMSAEEYAQRFVPPEESYLVIEEIVKALESDDPNFFGQAEHIIIRADGEKRYIIVRYGVIKNEEGRTIKTYGANQDITDLKKAEEALRDSEEKFREIFNKANDMISLNLMNEDGMPGRFIEINDVGIKRLGYSKEELLNMGPVDIVAPDKRPEMPKNAARLWKNKHATFEIVHITKDGRRIPIEINNHLIDYRGRITCLAISRDITKRKKAEKELSESEQKYRTLFNLSPDYTLLIGANSILIDVNEAAQEIVGLPREDLTGKSFTELKLLLNEEMPIHMKKVSQILKGKTVNPYESRFIDKNGKIRYVETFLKPLKEDGQITAFNVIAHDITERKKAEEKLKETIEELERSNYELQQFAYITSHDLQEPLRTIASFTQLIERRYKGQLDPDADEFIEFIVDAAIRMKGMIQGLLDYSRVGTKKIEFEDVDMNVKLEKALSNLKASINENKAEITYDHLPDVIADPDQMVRVFQNLISNAIKFRKPDIPPKIHIGCKMDKENNEYIFSVSDNGIGMEKEYTDKIFEVFKRLHTTDEYRGTGIGLAIAKRIIERHDGRIWVESKLGVGSTFYFALPISS